MTTDMRRAVELALIVGNVGDLPDRVVCDALSEAATDPVRALSYQAALTSAVALIAEVRVTAVLEDVDLLRLALAAAERGEALQAVTVGATRACLLADAGLAAARSAPT